MNSNDMTPPNHPRNDLALAEAALFLAPQPLTRRGLAKILGGVAQAYVDQLLIDLKEQFEDPSRGIEVHIEDGRAQFRVKAAYVDEVSHLAPQHDIPRQELRTLAVIAYNHPMTQANLIKIRGNKGYKHVQELIERNLITSEPHGRTCLLHVTRDFLRHFGLSSVEEFRIRFPTAAEENAEELARGTEADIDSPEFDESSRDDQEAVSADTAPLSDEADEESDFDKASADHENEFASDADSHSDSMSDASGKEMPDDNVETTASEPEAEDDTDHDDHEDKQEPPEEVERG